MKKGKNPAEEVRKTLELLDKVQRQNAPSDLHDRIMKELSNNRPVISMKAYRYFQLAAACLAMLMMFNAWLLFSQVQNGETATNNSSSDLNSFIEDYQLTTSEMYYFK